MVVRALRTVSAFVIERGRLFANQLLPAREYSVLRNNRTESRDVLKYSNEGRRMSHYPRSNSLALDFENADGCSSSQASAGSPGS